MRIRERESHQDLIEFGRFRRQFGCAVLIAVTLWGLGVLLWLIL